MGDVSAYANIPTILQPRVSPNASQVAYFSDRSGRHELYVTDTNGSTTRLTDGELPRDPSSPILWHSDGRRIYIPVGGREGDKDTVNVGVASLDGGIRTLFEIPTRTILWDIGPHGRFLWHFRAQTDGNDFDLVRYDQKTASQREVPLKGFVHRGGGVAPTGDRIAFNDNPCDDPHGNVYLAAADGGNRQRLEVNGDDRAFVLAWGPEGNQLLVSSDFESGTLGIYDLKKGATEWIPESEGRWRTATFLPDGDRIFTVRNTANVYDRRTDEWRKLDVNGSLRLPPIARDDACFGSEGVILIQSDETHPGKLLRYDLRDDETTLLVNTLPETISDSSMIRARAQSYPTDEGEEARALMYIPEVAEPAPAVAIVYGGNRGVYRSFDGLTQLLVAHGYVVCKPAMIGDPYSKREHTDFAAAGQWLSEHESVDCNRIAVYGHSHGGYNAYAQAVWNPDVWTAAIAYNGLTDLETLATEEDSLWNLRENMPDYNDSPETWRGLSPITDADSMSVPLLMLHGRNDPAVPVLQARRFRDALDTAGTEYYEYHELAGGHGGATDGRQKGQAWELVLEFLETHL
ncbi:prolyl oligopeptidase family serine peptidase [Halomontanus rarus]|uniref:prolyl oligopeptidase family serine peptidase n=1 Tax=Halomontanus rarus TaxID=3034020 RepID=UPI001A97FB5B